MKAGRKPAEPALFPGGHMSRRWFVLPAFVLLAAVAVASAHAQPLPSASGRVIEAAEGDVIVVPGGARVAVVTRTQVQARLVYVAAQQTLLLLTDPALGFGAGMPDAKGVRSWRIQHPWPLEPRWEGSATIDEYSPSGRGQPMAFAPLGLAIHTDRGTILVGPPTDREVASTPPPIAVVRTTAASGSVAQGSFDEIEQAWLAGGENALQGPGGRMQMHASGGIGAVASASISSAPAGAVRVGGNIRPPTRTQFAEPVYPQVARAASVQGVVILELVVGADGAVSNARILRSIPLLDQAALDAVRQWRYEPTLLNGVPTPVIMTATVNFTLPPAP
jgi:TonB family protein